MGWKKSKDGGLDFDVKRELEYRRVIKEMDERHRNADEKLINKYGGSAHTTTFLDGDYPVLGFAGTRVLTAKEKLQRFRAKKHREHNGN